MDRFRALVVTEAGAAADFAEVGEELLGDGEVVVEVAESSLNYKDALAASGSAPVVRHFPLVIGIDFAGTVVESTNPAVPVGDEVLVTGCGLGEEHSGGYARYARVPAEWCVRLPTGLDTRRAMALGTAGFTAMLCVMALERNGATAEALEGQRVLVTGAAGGVGSIAVALLRRLGYRVVAATGRVEEAPFLEVLGASEVVGRDALAPAGRGPLGPATYGAAVDVVGGATLAEVIRRLVPEGTVAACGLAGGAELETTVYPFILRGVTLAGVNSVHVEAARRDMAWQRLASLLDGSVIDGLSRTEPLSAVPRLAADVLAGKVRGRVVVDVAG